MRTVLAHFRNEAYLLPFWLKHHREIFDHGVMIDNRSTDESCDIIRELAPDWEIVPSMNEEWDPIDEDFERMNHEARFEGWKISLGITEFLCAASLANIERRVERAGLEGAHAKGVIMAERGSESIAPPSHDKPLTHQRHYGYYEEEVSWGGLLRRNGINIIKPRYASSYRNHIRARPYLISKKTYTTSRSRLYHKARQGAYHLGRHDTSLKQLCAPPQDDMLLLHYYFSPWTEAMRRRALDQGAFCSERHKKLAPKTGHLRYSERAGALQRDYLRALRRSRDLAKDPVFRENTMLEG